MCTGTDGVTYYVKIHAPFSVLCRKAEAVRLKMPLKNDPNMKFKKVKCDAFERVVLVLAIACS